MVSGGAEERGVKIVASSSGRFFPLIYPASGSQRFGSPVTFFTISKRTGSEASLSTEAAGARCAVSRGC